MILIESDGCVVWKCPSCRECVLVSHALRQTVSYHGVGIRVDTNVRVVCPKCGHGVGLDDPACSFTIHTERATEDDE